MKQIDKKRIENWRPYALLILTGGALTAAGTILTFSERLWEIFSPNRSFDGHISGLGGLVIEDNSKFNRFLVNNVGQVVDLNLQIEFEYPMDGGRRSEICVDDNNLGIVDFIDGEFRNSAQYVEMDSQIIFEMDDAFRDVLLDTQDQKLVGNTFLLSYDIENCMTRAISASADSYKLSYIHMHGFGASLQGEYFVQQNAMLEPGKPDLVLVRQGE